MMKKSKFTVQFQGNTSLPISMPITDNWAGVFDVRAMLLLLFKRDERLRHNTRSSADPSHLQQSTHDPNQSSEQQASNRVGVAKISQFSWST